MEYLAIEEDTVAELTVEVQRLIGEGWKPIGGIAAASNVYMHEDFEELRTNISFYQAMTRDDFQVDDRRIGD